MARATKDAKLDNATARAKLAARKKPHYRLIEPGLHVGYYRGKRGGTWIARRYSGAGAYETEQVGIADDGREADGAGVLTFAQAQSAARSWATQQAKRANGTDTVADAPWTVSMAMDAWLAAYRAGRTKRGTGKAARATEAVINAHIIPRLGAARLDQLTAGRIEEWLQTVQSAPRRVRTAKGKPQRVLKTAPGDTDAARRRKATANRVLTFLKAALTMAWRAGKVAHNDAWGRVSPYHDVSAPKIRYLSDTEQVRIVNACLSDLRDLVTGALLTGCRYGELATMRVADFDSRAGTVTVAQSKSGKARHVALDSEGRTFFSQHSAGRAQDAHIFERDLQVSQASRDSERVTRRGVWGRAQQDRPLKEACKSARIAPAIGFHILRHTYASRLAGKGVPMRVIADQLGHADTRMTEKHYAHLAPSYVAETVRAALQPLGILPASNVVTLPDAAV